MEKRQFKRRILILSCALILFIFIYLFEAGILSTISRYIKREQDEIMAYYTSLYLNTDGNGKTIALENNEGYVEFSLMNFVGEDVTQRDIEYEIKKPTEFYDESGNLVSDPSKEDKLYVLDVWGEPREVAKSTYLYSVSIESNTGEIGDGLNEYKFSYEKLGTSAVGKTHHINLKLSRTSGELSSEEPISIVVQLTKPYKEIYIINMTASNRLITFSASNTEKFDIEFDQLHIQTADLFAYSKAGVQRVSQTYDGSYTDKFTSKAFKITLTWNGYMLDEEDLEKIHNGTINNPDITDGGTNINQDEYYIDIDRPVYVYLESKGTSGTLTMFVPQSADFTIDFLPMSESAYVDVEVLIYVINGKDSTAGYCLYDSKYFGYEFDENDKYRVITN